MRYKIMLLFLSILLQGCGKASNETLAQKAEICMNNGGVPFVHYNRFGEAVDIACIKF